MVLLRTIIHWDMVRTNKAARGCTGTRRARAMLLELALDSERRPRAAPAYVFVRASGTFVLTRLPIAVRYIYTRYNIHNLERRPKVRGTHASLIITSRVRSHRARQPVLPTPNESPAA